MGTIRQHISSNVVGYVALFVALSGTAYAANTVGSSDIIDGSILSQDIKNGEVKNPDLGADSVGTGKILDNTISSADIGDGQVTSADIGSGQVTSADIGANEAKGADVDEASLNGSLIPGLNATPANEVHSSGRVAVVSADTAGTPTANMIDTGTFTVHGNCIDTGVRTAQLIISSSANYAVHSDDGLNLASFSGESNLVNFATPAESTDQRFGTFQAVASTGDALQGSYQVLTNAQGADCVFAVSGIGQ